MKRKSYNITAHGSERIDERLNIKGVYKKERQIQLALERGLDKDDATSLPKRLLEYIVSHEEHNQIHATVKLYNGAAYIFGFDNILITVWLLPKNIRKIYDVTLRKLKKRGEVSAFVA